MTDKAPVTVEQGDREAAANLYCDWFCTGDENHNVRAIREGISKDGRIIEQAFAAHRLQSIAALEEEIKRLREALTPSGSTKAAYHGEFAFNLHRIDDCGDEYVEKVYVPWDTVKQVMKAILARTALEGRGS